MNFVRNSTDSLQRLVHLLPSQTSSPAIVLHSDPIVSLAEAFIQPELHLSGQMVQPVVAGLDQLEFVLDIALVLLFLEWLDDLVAAVPVWVILVGVRVVDKLLQVHLSVIGFDQASVHFYDERQL